MKINLFFTAIFAFSMSAVFSQIKYGLSAGVSISNGTSQDKEEHVKETYDPITGLNIGLFTILPIGKKISLNPAINFNQLGSKETESYESLGGEPFTIDIWAKANCLELQLPVLYNTDVAKGKFFIGAGPTFTLAVNGKTKVNITGEVPEERKIKFGNSDNDDLRPFDIGANILVGYAIKNGFYVSANYNLGLLNLTPGKDANDFTMRFNYYAFKVGWLFGK